MQVTFIIPQGNVGALSASANTDVTGTVTLAVIAGTGQSSTVDGTASVQDGTTEYTECSGRGVCDYSHGTCDCFDNFVSSDGIGNPGFRGDCGYFYFDLDKFGTSLFCPYYINLDTNATELCSGHGTCNAGTCDCDSGYGGPGCSEKLCSSVNAWFGSVGQSHGGLIECAGVGDCNRKTGICTNCGGSYGTFSGDYCQYLSCDTDSSGDTCSGNGLCLTLSETAALTYNDVDYVESLPLTYTTPWDADMVKGCSCFREVRIDNQIPDTYNVSQLYR
jgi:hypothetical protein